MSKEVYLSASAEETEKLGSRLAFALLHEEKKRAYVALFGEMGVGKTAFSRGFCAALGIVGVHSPTYAIVHEYKKGTHPVFHFDMYRIVDEDDLLSIGFYDYLARDGYAISEWSENIEDALPEDAVRVRLERTEVQEVRRITIEGVSLGKEAP